MKQLKKGFSLSELLIALAIISIISVLGITISKKGMEKAYNQYIYNAYSSIQYAIADARNQGHSIDEFNVNNCKFMRHIIKIFNATEDIPDETQKMEVSFTTDNGVKYSISRSGNNDNGYSGASFLVQITVPSMAKKVNGKVKNNITFSAFYAPEATDLLIPFKEITDTPVKNEINLQDRMDLLPFYIDDGETGYYVQKCIADENSTDTCVMKDTPEPLNENQKKRQFMSFREAYCNIHTNGKNIPNAFVGYVPTVKCNDINTSNQKTGTIKVVDPRKVF